MVSLKETNRRRLIENIEEINTWAEIKELCPLNITRVYYYALDFNSQISVRLSASNINKCKKALIQARGYLDLMITSLMQLFYDKNILVYDTDKAMFEWLKEDVGRLFKIIDIREKDLLMSFDNPDYRLNMVGISKLAVYTQLLRVIANGIIFESLLKATKEYYKIEEKNYCKREPRTFLYILYQIVNITFSVLGNLSREKTTNKRGGTINNSYTDLMSQDGQIDIAHNFYKETGIRSLPPPAEFFKDELDEEVNFE